MNTCWVDGLASLSEQQMTDWFRDHRYSTSFRGDANLLREWPRRFALACQGILNAQDAESEKNKTSAGNVTRGEARLTFSPKL